MGAQEASIGNPQARPTGLPARRTGLAIAAGVLLLAGCGGGGGSSTLPAPPDPSVAGLRCSAEAQAGWCWQTPQPWAMVIDDVTFSASGLGWAVGDALLRSADGGASWQELPLPSGEPARALRWADPREGWLLGRQGGRMWHTRDGVQTWAALAPLPIDHATGLALMGSRALLVDGTRSDRAGEPLTLLSIPAPQAGQAFTKEPPDSVMKSAFVISVP